VGGEEERRSQNLKGRMRGVIKFGRRWGAV